MSNMKKSGKIYRIGALLVVVCLISTVMLSGTFAKYTDSYAGQDTALVARWSFAAEGGQSGSLEALTDPTAELDLFQHAYDTHINQNAGVGQDSRFIIAPGVEGEFTLAMDYLADVDADVEIDISPLVGNAAVPMEYSVDGTTWVKLDGLAEKYIAKIIGAGITDGTPGDNTFRIAKVANDSTDLVEISQNVQWRWPHEASTAVHATSSDAADTTLGEASNTAGLTRTKYGIKVTLTATQVTPAITTP